mmetsp:Transcript_17338/g.29281  ORF Transcript_17338/g.29281 Transcript_17338/m.29281 type:complete len:211 (+) Transcript_17338:279-911(+)
MCNLFNLVHILPSGREDDSRSSCRMEWSELAASTSKLLFQRHVPEVFRWGIRIVWIIEDEIASLKVFTLCTEVNHTRVMITSMRGFVSMKCDKVTLSTATTLLRRPSNILPRIRLQRQQRLQIQSILMSHSTSHPLNKSHKLNNRRSRNLFQFIKRQSIQSGVGIKINLILLCKCREDVTTAFITTISIFTLSSFFQWQILVLSIIKHIV